MATEYWILLVIWFLILTTSGDNHVTSHSNILDENVNIFKPILRIEATNEDNESSDERDKPVIILVYQSPSNFDYEDNLEHLTSDLIEKLEGEKSEEFNTESNVGDNNKKSSIENANTLSLLLRGLHGSYKIQRDNNTLLRSCRKQVNRDCKKVCYDSIRDACRSYGCRSSFKEYFNRRCRRNCNYRF
ncbi:hypothetical protein K1T71_013890 [Dendrolimus kikuchii]|uniref:Uncharacterized protein n=1 Tax=Dendrolimus kikuchii TaxID=765133 RepID=A0ACC1CG22_9NEOP|nr:hypothetical protein K1T71_013890 [Dendrolimus kikuchii]